MDSVLARSPVPRYVQIADLFRQRIARGGWCAGTRVPSNEELMREFDVSRTHLYRIFADKGGLASAIRERRLDAAFHRLRRAEAIDISITDVALDLGFSSSAQFARAFRARFAMSPSEARFNADRPSSGNAVLSLQGHLRERLMELSRET